MDPEKAKPAGASGGPSNQSYEPALGRKAILDVTIPQQSTVHANLLPHARMNLRGKNAQA